MEPSTTRLRAYGGTDIPILGLVTLPVKYNNLPSFSFDFYVTRKGSNLLGLDLFDRLGFRILEAGQMPSQVQLVDGVGSRWKNILTGLGEVKGFSHRPAIREDVLPVQQPLRRLPLSLREEVSEELQRMIKEGIIESTDTSAWISNVVVVRKKSGDIRLCLDLRNVNKAVVLNRFPIPTIEELTSEFHGAVMFSKLDLKQGYLQIPLEESSLDLTAFVTHEGVFRFRRVPFGLASAPSAFQKIMCQVLAGLRGVTVFLDDIVVHGSSKEEHDSRLESTLQRLSEYLLTLNSQKCCFDQQEIEFMGYVINSKGLYPIDSKVKAILDIPNPKDAKELASLLGITGYYSRFICDYASVSEPLRHLLRKNTILEWSEECEAAVKELKMRITSPPVLACFSMKDPIFVTCDASGVAVGAVLSQLQEGCEKPIAFASRVLSEQERKYSVAEREALACIWACEKWHIYLYGRHFVLRTDHRALTSLLHPGGSGHRPLRLHRWADRLQQYNFDVEYRPGRQNQVADFLSRSPVCEGWSEPRKTPFSCWALCWIR